MKSEELDEQGTIAEILAQHSPQVQGWVEQLRKIIKETILEAREKGIKGWHVITYEANSTFCYISPQKNGANLGFYKGISLTDPQHVLQGTSKNMRHVKIHQDKDIQVNIFQQLLREAYQQNRSKRS